jgi:hypothetical protein
MEDIKIFSKTEYSLHKLTLYKNGFKKMDQNYKITENRYISTVAEFKSNEWS